jgi:hypothetical protein
VRAALNTEAKEFYLFETNIKVTGTTQGKAKVKLYLCLTKHHAMKTYGGMGV